MASPITTHVLDTMRGRPAQGVAVVLEFKRPSDWAEIAKDSTNADGRAADLLPKDAPVHAGTYRLTFDTKAYFTALGVKAFYPSVSVVFEIHDAGHYHVPLLLSPFGYSTYRGS